MKDERPSLSLIEKFKVNFKKQNMFCPMQRMWRTG
jgi:hypothetical protein